MSVPPLSPAHPQQMLGEAIEYLKSLPRDAASRADVFEEFARQIEAHSRGSWNAPRGSGTDGSIIFLGRQGEALVVSPQGSLFRGGIGSGIRITTTGPHPDYDTLNPLD